MSLNPAAWRDSAAYDYLDTLIPSDLAWECLRRNTRYRHDFAAATRGQTALSDVTAIRQRWGLRFPDGARSFRDRGDDQLDAAERSVDRHAGRLAARTERLVAAP